MEIIIHTPYNEGKKEYTCEYCSKVLKSRKAWKDHLRIHTGEKPHKCPFPDCDKTFVQYSSLQKHQRIHVGEKPYKCEKCGQEFSQACNLKRHERLHNGERPFSCEICQKTFTTSTNLKQHMETHDKKLFTCPSCGRIYSNIRSFRKHLKVHKNVTLDAEEVKASEENSETEDPAINIKGIKIEEVPAQIYGQEDLEIVNSKRLPAMIYHSQQKMKKVKGEKQPQESPSDQMDNISFLGFKTERKFDGHTDNNDVDDLSNEENKNIKAAAYPQEKQSINFMDCIGILHQNHTDRLYQGKLYYQKETGDWEEHTLENSDHNPSDCRPLKEMSHIPNYSSLTEKYETLIQQKSGVTRDMLSNSCNALFCGGCSKPSTEPAPETKPAEPPKEVNVSSVKKKSCCGGGKKAKSAEPQTSSCSCSADCVCKRLEHAKSEAKNAGECEETAHLQKFSGCLCSETASLKHVHGEGCGHPIIIHDGHTDYIVDGRLHHVHGNHCDDHGLVDIIKEKDSPSKRNQIFGEVGMEEI